MSLSSERIPDDFSPEDIKSYLERMFINVSIELNKTNKLIERAEMPSKPQNGAFYYFGNPATHNYDSSITTEGFWGYENGK